MGKYSSASVGFLVNGYPFTAAVIQNLSHKVTSATEPAFGVGDAWEKTLPSGVQKVELTQGGAFFDDTAITGMHTALGLIGPQQSGGLTPQSVPAIVCLQYAGNTIGKPFTGIQGDFLSVSEALSVVGKITKENVTHTVSGQADQGFIVHANTAESAAGDTKASSIDHTTQFDAFSIPIVSNTQANPTVITTSVPHKLTTNDTVLIAGNTGSNAAINGVQTVTVISPTTFSVPVNCSVAGGTGGTALQAMSNLGGSAYLQVVAVTLGGYTSWTVLLLHSTDNSTFVTLATFANITAAQTAQLVSVAGAVRRYLAASHALNGAGSGPSLQYMAGFARY
jgi:hypothetical protein